MIYSYSSISTYKLCPQKFSFQYKQRLKVPEKTPIDMFMGKMVHESLEELYRQKETGNIWNELELTTDFEERWAREFNPTIVITTNSNPSEIKEWGLHCLRQYHQQYFPFNEETIGIEQTIQFELGENGPKLRGVIDRVVMKESQHIQIIDYKTYQQIPPAPFFDENEQLALYQLWIKQKYPDIRRIELVWDFVGLNKRVQKELNETQLGHVKQKTVQTIEKIDQAKQFPTKTGKHCESCAFQSHCPAFNSSPVKTLMDFT